MIVHSFASASFVSFCSFSADCFYSSFAEVGKVFWSEALGLVIAGSSMFLRYGYIPVPNMKLWPVWRTILESYMSKFPPTALVDFDERWVR